MLVLPFNDGELVCVGVRPVCVGVRPKFVTLGARRHWGAMTQFGRAAADNGWLTFDAASRAW